MDANSILKICRCRRKNNKELFRYSIKLKMKIIPAIDIIGGKCVRLTQGNYGQCKIYSANPLEMARLFEEAGLDRLHLVDLDGAKASGVVNWAVLETICKHTRLSVDFGGGVKTDEDMRRVFEAGADYACIGSIAQTNPEQTAEWLEKYGYERVIIGADVWNTKVCIQGWKKVTDTTIFQLIKSYRGRIGHLMCTDITRDGMMDGTAIGLYRELLRLYPEIRLIASGGVSGTADLQQLAEVGVEAVVVGKALYEKKIDLKSLKNF